MVGAHSRPHFSEDERAFMVLKYTETGNVLETIGKFQRQFPSQGTPCKQTIMDNYNKYMSSMVKFGRERRQQWTFLFGNCL